MNELETILALKTQTQEEIRRMQEKLKALEVVERMVRDSNSPANVVEIQPKIYKDMKQDAAIQDVLRKATRALTAAEITDALKRGGFGFRSANPRNSVYVTLKTNRKGYYEAGKRGKKATFKLTPHHIEVNVAN